MSFIVDKEQIKPGLIIFRRGDVEHDNFLLSSENPKRGPP